MNKMDGNFKSELQVALNDFSLNFLKCYHKAGDKHKNLFYSPISLANVFSLLLSGADGRTKKELTDLLGYGNLMNDEKNNLEVAFKKMREGFKPKGSAKDWPIFKMPTRLYLQEQVRLQDDFRRIAKEAYDAEVLEVNFQRDCMQLVVEINEWVRLETNNKIENAINWLKPETLMVLINVVYFKGKWREPFIEVYSKEFTNLSGHSKQVETMCEQRGYPFGQFEQYRIAQLHYIGESSMYIVLPNENINLHDMLLDLNARTLDEHLDKLKYTELDLQLPKFRLQTELDLKALLEQLGVTSLFDEADLSKMTKGGSLWVSRAKQKAYIRVDEEGTEAAAMSYCVCDGIKPRAIEFHANRPFIFLIRLNGVNIFIGAVKDLE